jgi:hypothetical protein
MRMFSDWRSWKSWRALLILFVACWVLTIAGLNGLICYENWQQAKAHPELAVMPTPLPDTRVDDLQNGTTVEVFGYSLRLPWNKITKRLDVKGASFVDFEGGGRLMIFDPASQVDKAQQYRKDASTRAAVQKMMSSRDVSSPYQLFKAEMESSPAHTKFWHTRASNSRDFLLLIGKGQFAREGTTAIYAIEGGELRGYESVPSKPRAIALELFGARGDELELWLVQPKAGALTQAQINAVIASIKTPDKGCLTPGHCG